MAFQYSAFGLRLEVNRPVPGLLPSTERRPVDVRVWLDELPPWAHELRTDRRKVWYVSERRSRQGIPILRVWKLNDGEYFRLLYSAGADVVVDRSGSRIWARSMNDASFEDLTLCLLGPALGFVLRLRGTVCLHASAVAVGSRSFALVGPAGAGKSTTAAAFADRGYRVLSDDVVALEPWDRSFRIQPAYPRLGLWPQAVEVLFGDRELPRLSARLDKRFLELDPTGFEPQPVPLAALYLLASRRDDPSAPSVEPVSGHAGFVSLAANGYGRYLPDQELRAREFQLLSRLVGTVPMRRVTPHSAAAELPRLCAAILHDFEQLNFDTAAAA